MVSIVFLLFFTVAAGALASQLAKILYMDDERMVNVCEQNTCAEAFLPYVSIQKPELEPIKIKLKDCCLTCPDFDPRGVIGWGVCAIHEREIACGHMAVCYKYLGLEERHE